MEVSAFRGSTPANISAPSLDGKGGDEPDGREHERALVRRAQDGDRDAFGDLYRTHLPAISRLVRFRLGTEDEDAVSEVFLRAWRGLGPYRDEPRDELPERGVEPVTAEVLTLRGAIDHLPTEQRQVIELKYLVGMTNEEVAAAMGTTPGAVNAKQWRALKALADVLEERA